MKITNIQLNIIPDSRNNPTLEAVVESEGITVISSVPSGKSTGKNEAEIVPPQKALEKVDWIFSQIKDHDFATLDQFDNLLMTLDGTENKSVLGANLILALSIAFTKLLAKKGNMEIYELVSRISGSQPKLPLCFFNLINGGIHAHSTALRVNLPFQEYIFIPQTNSPKESLEQVMLVIKNLGEKIQEKYGQLKQGDEGGYIVSSPDPEEGLELLSISTRPGLFQKGQALWRAFLSIDVAASTFYENGKYNVGGKIMNTDELLFYFQSLVSNFQLLSLEDPFAEDDWDGFEKITKVIGEKIWIVGDDLITTNVKRIREAHEKNAISGVIIKPNQIGTVSETIQAANLAKSYGYKIIISNRSGETMDVFIADLAVGLRADGLKAGCPLQKERLVKYERLIEIEKTLNTKS